MRAGDYYYNRPPLRLSTLLFPPPLRYHGSMEREGQRHCDACGQIIPKMAKLAARENGRDLCLACRIRETQIARGLGPTGS